MKNIYKKHVFVCENQRNSSIGKSCGEVGSEFRMILKREIAKRKLNNKIRINKSGCLGKCNQGACLVIYPEGKWYFNIKADTNHEELIDIIVSK